MKQKLVIACLFLIIMILPVFCFGSDEQSLPDAALAENSYEFDPVLDGAQIIHDFVIMNKGSAVLDIQKVETG
jgi:hypothetical protein